MKYGIQEDLLMFLLDTEFSVLPVYNGQIPSTGLSVCYASQVHVYGFPKIGSHIHI